MAGVVRNLEIKGGPFDGGTCEVFDDETRTNTIITLPFGNRTYRYRVTSDALIFEGHGTKGVEHGTGEPGSDH